MSYDFASATDYLSSNKLPTLACDRGRESYTWLDRNHPAWRIDFQDSREIEIDCETAIDAGLYIFTYN